MSSNDDENDSNNYDVTYSDSNNYDVTYSIYVLMCFFFSLKSQSRQS